MPPSYRKLSLWPSPRSSVIVIAKAARQECGLTQALLERVEVEVERLEDFCVGRKVIVVPVGSPFAKRGAVLQRARERVPRE